jgi:cullin 3
MKHVALMNEVTGACSVKFNPSPQDIKKSIEELISKEYLERAPDDFSSL